jgi:hypothetical protein
MAESPATRTEVAGREPQASDPIRERPKGGAFDILARRYAQAREEEEHRREKKALARAANLRAVKEGHITPEEGIRNEARFNQLDDIDEATPLLAKAIGSPVRRGPSVREIIKHGWFSELPKARNQLVARR